MIKYGSIIRIHGTEQGLLVAKSFTDLNVYFMLYSNLRFLSNYRESLFQILPRGSFEIHDEFQKSNDAEKKQLMLRLKTEIDQYKIVIQNKMNEEVLFGAEIVLKHIDSEYYLVGSYNCSEFCTDAFKLELSQYLSTQAVFKILPSYSYQQEGQPVYHDEPVMLEHDKTRCRIDYVQGHPIFLDEEFESQTVYKYRPSVKKIQGRLESVITHNSEANWLIQLHEEYQSSLEKVKIKPFDLCVFRNTENNSYLSVANQKVVMKSLKNQDMFEYPFDAIWEIEPVLKTQRVSITTTPANQKPGIHYIIRHYVSGKMLNNLGGLSQEAGSCILQIRQVSPGKEQLSNFSFVKIMSNSQELQMINRQFKKEQEEDQELFFKSLDPSDLEYVEYDVAFRQESKHAFQIWKISLEAKQNFLTILSSQELLLKFADILKLKPEYVEKKINPKILKLVVTQLQRLLVYLLNDIDGEHSENQPQFNKQKYMKDLQMVEIIMEIIFYMSYKNGLERLFLQWKSDRERTKHIFKLSYKLIENLVKNNPITKLHVSQWLELFLHSAMMIDDGSVQNCLSELLDNNYSAISKFITKQSIKRLIDILRIQLPHEKYLKILSSICICSGKSIISNQIHALNLFFCQMPKEYKIEIKKENGKVLIYCSISKTDLHWRTVKQLHSESQEKDELQTWNYFLSYMNLLGDVCTNRNKFAKKYVEEHFSLETLCSILEDPDTIQLNAIEPILKVIHGAYLDCQYYTPIRRLARVREWETIEKKNDVLRTHAEEKLKPENCEVKRVMLFIQNFISEFGSFDNRSKNLNLYCILQALKTTLRLGFWLSISNLIDMLPCLFRILSQEDGKFVQQEIRSKTLICEIIDIIIDMETNVRVSKTTQSLKKMLNNDQQAQVLQNEKTRQETPKVIDQQSNSGKKQPTMTLTYLLEKSKNKIQFLPSPRNKKEEKQEINIFKDMANVLRREINEKDQIYNVDQWMALDKHLIETRSIFVKVNVNIELILQRLSYYEDPLLLQYSLTILNRIYGQRTELRKNFEKVIIVATGITWQLSVESRVTRTKLLAVVDRNILQCTLENQKDYNIYLWRESENPKESGIIQDLHQLVETMKQDKQNFARKRCPFDSLHPENALDALFNEVELPHKLHQSLLKSQDLHDSIISFLEISQQIQNPLIMKFLHACYKFLTMLIWNHLENKQDFCKYRHLMYNHIQFNIGCIDFFKELFQNNKTLLFSEKDVITISNYVIDYANRLTIKQFYKAKLLDFLRILLIYNNKIIKFNQVLVMSKLQEKQNTNIIYLLNPTIHQTSTLFSLEEIKLQISEYEAQECPIVRISPELSYLFTFFQIFSLLVEDRNSINPGKCRQMHTYPQLLQLLEETKSFWPLKRYVRAYINRLYYDTEDFENISQLMIEKDLNLIIEDFDLIIAEKERSQVRMIENPVRYSYMNSYVFLCLEETLITLNTILSKEQFLYDLEDILYSNFIHNSYQVHLQLFEIGHKLALIRKLYQQSRQIDVFTRVLINIFKSIFGTFDINLLFIREGLLNEALQMKCITEQVRITKRRMSGSRITEEPPIVFETTSNPTQLFEVEKSETAVKYQLISNIFENQDQNNTPQRKVQSLKKMFIKTEDDINEQLNQKHRRLVNTLNASKRFQRFLEEEFIQVCEKLRSQPTINQQDFIRNSIKLNMQNQISDHLKIFLLRLLTRMITEKNTQNKDIYLSIDQWQPEFWSNCKNEIEQTQEFLKDCGAAEFICELLMEQNLELRMQLTSELLTFIIAFLLGGNTKCQDAILLKLKKDQSNLMLTNFSIMIKKIGRAVYNNFKIRKSRVQELQFNVLMVDNYDYLDQEQMVMKRCNVIEHDEAKETSFKKSAIEILCRSFRVLQLLNENNNVAMKNFMRVQVDQDKNVKLNSINFIELTTIQLRMFLKIISKPILVIPTAMIEFLVEIIQLPCLENQIMLCKTTFYEDTCYMSRFFQNQANQQSRMFEKQDDLWDLYELQSKILLSVMSVLEGNDEKIYEDLQNKLEPRFLIDFVNQNLQILQVQTHTEMDQLLKLQEQLYSSEILRILNVIIIKKKIQGKVPESTWVKELEQLQSEQLKKIFKLLESNIRNIEIIYFGKQQQIFFPSHPLFQFLSDQTKDKLMFNVSRDTQREKILGLIEAKQIIFNEIEYNYDLNQLAIPVTHKSITSLRATASSISVCINLLMILFYEIQIRNKQARFQAEIYEQLLLRFLSVLQLFSSLSYVLLYSLSRIPLILKQAPQQHNMFIKQIYYVITHEEELFQLITYVGISIMGQFKPYYFSLHLFDLFSRLSLLQNVFQAISYNAKQLLVVALLGVLFVYVFSITGLNQYVDDIYPVEEPEDSCDSIISCMITLITSGVIGNSMSKWDPIKFVLDTVYFVFFALLFTNIVSGIMIDTFAELRDKRQKIEDDKKNLCFICGVDRQTLEKNLEEFDTHIREKHYLWNYIFYMYILLKKDSTEYTGLEYWISDKIQKEDINWFPMLNFDRNQLQQQYEQLQQQMAQLQRTVDSRLEEIAAGIEQNIIKI